MYVNYAHIHLYTYIRIYICISGEIVSTILFRGALLTSEEAQKRTRRVCMLSREDACMEAWLRYYLVALSHDRVGVQSFFSFTAPSTVPTAGTYSMQ